MWKILILELSPFNCILTFNPSKKSKIEKKLLCFTISPCVMKTAGTAAAGSNLLLVAVRG